MSEEQKKIRTLHGMVVSDKMNKSSNCIVRASSESILCIKNILERSTKLHVHDENNECSVGDKVAIKECRPISKTKSWQLW